uniref:F-box domain-containing protein n=1 Tax=Plectus sambesii TaxID=2011161 RepID=A0A914UTR4_9BILA
LQLEDVVAQRQFELDAVLSEQDALKRRFDSLGDFLRQQAASQSRGRMQLANFIDNLIEEAESANISNSNAEVGVLPREAAAGISASMGGATRLNSTALDKPPTPADSGYHEFPFHTHFQTPTRLPDRFDPMPIAAQSTSISRLPKSGINYATVTAIDPYTVPRKVHAVEIADEDYNDQSLRTIWRLVFERLDPVDLLLCMTVCRSWKSVASHSSLWSVVRIQNRAISAKILSMVAKYATEMKALTLLDLKLLSSKFNEPVKPGCCEWGFEAMLKASNKNLEFLKIAQCGVLLTDRCLWMAGCHNPKVRTIVFLSDLFALTSGVAWALGCGCRRLQTLVAPPLTVRKTSAKENRLLTVVAKCWPATMTALAVGGSFVTIEGLIDIAKGCVNLEHLELNDVHCIGETQAKILCHTGFRSLRFFTLDCCKISANTIVVFHDKLPVLEKLRVTVDLAQSEEQISLAQLEELRRRYGAQRLELRLLNHPSAQNKRLH